MATVGGNLAHGDPANDHPATMLALGAEVVAVGTAGERRIPIGAFFEQERITPAHHVRFQIGRASCRERV